MLALFLLIFVVREQMASGRDFCGPPPKRNNTVPVTGSFELEAHVRIECKEGFVRKAGTSNLIRCRKENGETDWRTSLPLECIYNPSFPSPPTQATKATALNESTQTTAERLQEVLRTDSTGVVFKGTASKSPPLVTESFTTYGAVASTSSSFKNQPHWRTITSSLATTKGNSSLPIASPFDSSTSLISTITVISILCLAATVFLLWRRSRHSRHLGDIMLEPVHQESYTPVPVCTPEDRSQSQTDSS